MGDHAPLAPSAAHRWMNCPGSVAASVGLPTSDTEYSREGTFAHDIASQALKTGKDAIAYRGVSNGEFTVDTEMAADIQVYLDAVRAQQLLTDGKLRVEQKVTYSDDVWGTSDASIVSRDLRELDVLDLKFGRGLLVEAVDNEQLLIYALALLTTLADGRLDSTLKVIRLHIVQPRRPDSNGEFHREWEISVEDLNDFALKLEEAVHATKAKKPELVAGDHCQWCPAASTCPALQAEALRVAREVFPKGDPEKPVKPPHPSTFSAAQLGKLLDSCNVVEAWIAALRQHAEERAQSGVAIPGFKLIETIGNRRWDNEDTAIAALETAGVDPYDQKVISPKEAERRLGKARIKLLPKTARPVTGVKLVHESDKRPALNNAQVFIDNPLPDA